MHTNIKTGTLPLENRLKINIRSLQVPASTKPLGFRVTGHRAGPSVVVAGHGSDAQAFFRRLLMIESLPWLRGDLVLLSLDNHHTVPDEVVLDQVYAEMGRVDRTLHLTDGKSADLYWTILRFLARVGMISGRGVPDWRPVPRVKGISSADPVLSAL